MIALRSAAGRRKAAGAIVLIAVGLLMPLVVGTGAYHLVQLEYIASMLMIAIGLDIVTGFAGQLSLGPGAVFAISGYAVVIFANHFPTVASLPLLCLIGVLVAIVTGLVAGMPSLRVGGFYLAMTTLFLALLVPSVAQDLSFDGADQGVSLISNIDFNQSPDGMTLYVTTIIVVALVGLSAWALLYSKLGHRFLTLRTSEDLAASLGINAYRTKLLAFVISSVPAGLAAAFYVFTQQFFTPDSAPTDLSIYLVAGCVIGGFGTVAGPIIGAALVLGLEEFLGSLNEYQGIIFGVALIAVISTIPDGLVATPLWRKGLDLVTRKGRKREGPEMSTAADDLYSLRGLVHTPTALSAPATNGTRPPAGPADGPPLVVKGAGRSFGGVVAVDDVDLTVRRGTIHALIGPNGSGKTTTLNLISGFYRLDRGCVELGGKRIDGHGAALVAKHGIGRTFQTPKLLTDKDVAYNVIVAADSTTRTTAFESVFRLPRGRKASKQARKTALECLAEVGLADVADEVAGKMSHGVQRLIEVARVMAIKPSFYLLDEPAAGLSQYEVEIMKSVVRLIAASGAGILLVEHNLPLVLDLADEITVLHRGQRIAHGDPDEVASNEEVARVYLGREVAAVGEAGGVA